MRKIDRGYEFVCGISGNHDLAIKRSSDNPRGVYVEGIRGARLDEEEIVNVNHILTRFLETGSLFPPEKTKVEILEEQVVSLQKQMASIHADSALKTVWVTTNDPQA